jgi:hypothetical protein
VLIEEPFQEPGDKLVRPELGRHGLIDRGQSLGDAPRGELFLVLDEDGLVPKVWILLQALYLVLDGIQDVGRVDSMYTANHAPVAGNVMLADELLELVKRFELEPGYLGRTVPDPGLTMPAVLPHRTESVLYFLFFTRTRRVQKKHPRGYRK